MVLFKARYLARLTSSAILVVVIFGTLPIVLSASPNNGNTYHERSSFQQDDIPATVTALYEQLQAINATKTAIARATPLTLTTTVTAMATSTPIRTRVPIPTPTQTPVPTVTATATRLVAVASVLVPTLNIRSGPGTDFSVVARGQAGDVFPIMAQTGGCAWLQVIREDGAKVWISGSPAFIQMNVACNGVPEFAEAHTTVTPAPTTTPRISVQSQPTSTQTQPRSTPIPSPTGSLRTETSGPTSVRIDAPADNVSVADTVTFAWTPDRPLASGQVYELAFWKPDETWSAGRSQTGASDKTTAEVRLSNLGSGTYIWGIILGTLDPNSGAYQRLRFLGGNRTIVVSGSGSTNTGQGDNNPDNPHAGEK